jgi:hypothetical protein
VRDLQTLARSDMILLFNSLDAKATLFIVVDHLPEESVHSVQSLTE